MEVLWCCSSTCSAGGVQDLSRRNMLMPLCSRVGIDAVSS